MLTELLLAITIIVGLIQRIGRKIAKLQSLTEKISKYGDFIHGAYAVVAGRIASEAVKQANAAGAIISALLALLFVLYEFADWTNKKDTLAKDILVFTAVYTIVIATSLGIPVQLPW